MSAGEQPSREHQVGITNAQVANPDPEISRLTREMNALFAEKRYAEAGRLAMEITAQSKEELRDTFNRHNVTVLHLDHAAFGIYAGQIEPTYDTLVEGTTQEVLAAAAEFGRRHAQEMILIARKLAKGEIDPAARLGLIITLQVDLSVLEAVRIVEVVQALGFAGATFAPKGQGTIVVYHTESLEMSPEVFVASAAALADALKKDYPQLLSNIQKFIIHMPGLL